MSDTVHFTSTDPTEIASQTPKGPTREQTLKAVQDKWPGHISWVSDRANFSGCRVIRFEWGTVLGLEAADDALFREQMLKEREDKNPDAVASPEQLANLYFSTRANLLVVDMKISDSTIVVLMTTQLDEEDLEELQEVNRRVQIDMREWREKREEAKLKAVEAHREERRLIEVGKTAEAHNLAGRIRELEAALKEARKS